MLEKRFTLDKDILLYSIDRDAGKKQKIALKIVEKSMESDCVLLTPVLVDFYLEACQKISGKNEQIISIIKEWLKIFPVQGQNAHIILEAFQAISEYPLSFNDALILSVARDAGCTLIVSEKFGSQKLINGLVSKNPFELANPLNFLSEERLHDRALTV